jgi:hypothetical protein
MALVKYIPNRFEDVVHEYESDEATLLAALRDFAVEHPQFMRPLIWKRKLATVNGEVIANDDMEGFALQPDDVIELTHTLEGGFFSSIYGWFASLGKPAEIDTDGDVGGSDVYDFEGPKTKTKGDMPVHIIYGEHLTGGQLINFNMWSDGQVNYLDMLLAVSEGEVHGIPNQDEDAMTTPPTAMEDVATQEPYIKLNDAFVTDYEDCQWAFRVGTNYQTSITGFRNISTVYDQNNLEVPGPDTWTTTYTTNSDIDRYDVKLVCPALFKTNKKGKIRTRGVNYQIRHQLTASPGSAWDYQPNTASWFNVSDKSKSEVKTSQEITVASRDQWDIEIRRESPATDAFDAADNLQFDSITEYVDEDLAYPNTAVVAIRVKATDQISGSFPNVLTMIRGRKVRVPDLGGGREFNDYYWTGTGLNFLLLADDSDPVTWDGTSYTDQWTQNPAYIMRDLLLNTRYGMGQAVDAADLDEATIDSSARYCWQKEGTTHKNRLNFIIDTKQDPPTVLAQMALVSRIFIFWNGGYIKFKYERDEDPIQLFSMGNITQDSFTVNYTAYTKIPNVVEVQYADKDQDYKTITREVVDESEWALGKARRVKKVNLLGVTDVDQSLREAKLYLNKARFSRKTVNFKTTIGAAQCEPGDIIAFQHDVPQWGWGGRAVDGTSNTIVLDEPVAQDVLDDPTAYDIQVQFTDDVIDIKDIVSATGNTITISGSFTYNPQEDDPYIIGVVDSTIAEYRINSMQLSARDEISIVAGEHVAAIYSDTGMEVSTDESTELPNPAEAAPDVEGLALYELHNEVGFGISFRQPEATLVFNYAEIWLSTDNIKFVKVAEGYGDDDVEYYNCLPGIEYFVRVYSVNKIGIKSTTYVEDSIVLSGKQIKYPAAPTGLEVEGGGLNTEFAGKDCKVVWRINAPYGGAGSLEPEQPAGQGPANWALVKDFVVQIWNQRLDTMLREEITTDQFYTYTYEKNWEDNNVPSTGSGAVRQVWIKVYQRNYYNYISETPALINVSNPAPDMTSIVPVLSPVFQGARVNFTSFIIDDNDMDYFKVYYGFTNPPTASVDHISRSAQTYVVQGQLQNKKMFVSIEPYDSFGVGSSTAVGSVTTLGFDFIDEDVNQYTLKADSVVASIIKHGDIQASHMGVSRLSAITANIGSVNAGYISGVIITGGLFRTATPGNKRIEITSDGIALKIPGTTGGYGDIRYGTDTGANASVFYGAGAVAFIHHVDEAVPFYIQQEQSVADFHFYNRGADPSGAAELGDVAVVNGSLKICSVAGAPGTWVFVR